MTDDFNWRLTVVTILHSVLGTATEYHYAAVNVPEKVLKSFVNGSIYFRHGIRLSRVDLEAVWSSELAALSLGGMLGGMMVSYLAERFGRRNTIMIWNNIILILSCLFQFFSLFFLSFEMLLVGRFLAGVSMGVYYFLPVFLAECAPQECRGFVGTIWGVGGCLWQVLATVLGLPQLLGTPELWPFLLAVPIIPAAAHMTLAPFIPKSPKYLYITKGNHEAAEASLRFYHGPNANVEERLAEFKQESEQSELENQSNLRQILKTPHLRFAFFICLIVNIAVCVGGVDVVANLSTYIFNQTGLDELQSAYGTIGLCSFAVVLSIISPIFTEKFGRRPLILGCIACGAVSTTFLFIATIDWSVNEVQITFAILGVLGIYAGQYMGLTRICGLLPGEICPQGCRHIVASWSIVANWMPSLIINLVFPSTNFTIGAFSYLPFSIFGVAFFIWLYRYLPETKHKSVAEIVGQWIPLKDDMEGLTLDYKSTSI